MELMMRFGIWLSTHAKILDVNSQNLNYTFGHNQFSDLTAKEFKEQALCNVMLGERDPENEDI